MKKHQRGFTMIELLVSMALGLTLLAGIGVMFTTSQKIYKTQRSLGYMMEDGRYILETLSKELRRTDFLRNKTAANGAADNLFRFDSGAAAGGYVSSTISGVLGSGFSMSQGFYIQGLSSGAAATNDAFVIRYQINDQLDIYPDNSSSPCSQNIGLLKDVAGNFLENPATEPHVVSIYFYVANDADGIPVLYCRAKREVITAGATPTMTECNGVPSTVSSYGNCLLPDALPLISNVERLIVRYGIDSDTVPDGAANYYMRATGIAASDWSRVVAVKLYVVLRTDEDNIAKNAGTFSIEGAACSGTTGIMRCPDAANRRIYKVFSTTVALRNVVS